MSRGQEQRFKDSDLSKMLFEARERIEMHVDIVERQTGSRDDWGRKLVADIDRYRVVERGWYEHGFGGEDD